MTAVLVGINLFESLKHSIDCWSRLSLLLDISLHPTMNESGSSVKIEELFDSSYFAWKQKLALVLTLRGVENYIDDGQRSLDNDPDGKFKDKWDRGCRKAQAIIGLSMSDEHLEHVRDATVARDMWVKI